MGRPWNDWFHVMGNTYGTWLPGDPRGWRTAHHKHHVNGDYKHPPPPGTGNALHAWAKQHLKHDAVYLSPNQRRLACNHFVEALQHHNIEFTELAMGVIHFHLLARFPLQSPASPDAGAPTGARAVSINPAPRQLTGKAKSWTTHNLKKAGHFTNRKAGLWASKCKVKPVTDAEHFEYLRTTYIPRHIDEGAVLWSQSPASPDAETH